MKHDPVFSRKLLRILCFLCGLVVLVLSLITADHIPLHERVLIQGVGIDRNENGRFHVTVQAVSTSAGSDVEVFEADGGSVYDALNNVTRYAGKTPFYTQTSLVIIGESCARQSLRDVFDFFIWYPEARPAEAVFIAKGSAKDILTLESDPQITVKDETVRSSRYVLARQIEQLATGDLDPQLMHREILDTANALYRPCCDVYLPVLSVEKDRIAADGCAVFRGDALSALLDRKDAAVIKSFHAPLEGGALEVSLPSGGSATFSFNTSSCSVVPEIRNGIPHFRIDFSCSLRLEEMILPRESKTDDDTLRELKTAAAAQIRRDMTSTLEQLISRHRSDVTRFGESLFHKETDWWKHHETNWETIFPRVTYDLHVTADIAEEGQELSPGPVPPESP